jgi:hypothetical protein
MSAKVAAASVHHGKRDRRGVADDAAAVDGGGDLPRVETDAGGEHLQGRLLRWVVGPLVRGEVPAVMHAGRQEAGVVAGAVVLRLERAVAAQVGLGEPQVGEHATDESGLEVETVV